ncbi:hypothetical protein TEA_003744 [Camellia sinensis var. sinensis]|uniref:adenylate kinase n=1 Tax=Camellia sinensis var. sinensis TaxID=542762 RepID=A0A4S4DLG6_CAMSN|nr:hypothetical protein TEA_003744 [Camellia sinensis var. sinensis]
MAAMNRLLKPSQFSSSSAIASLRRCLSSAAASETESRLKSRSCLPPSADPKGRNVQWVFLGCPGVGKGTYASRLSSLLSVPHIATGDLVRQELSSHGPLSHQVLDVPLIESGGTIPSLSSLRFSFGVSRFGVSLSSYILARRINCFHLGSAVPQSQFFSTKVSKLLRTDGNKLAVRTAGNMAQASTAITQEDTLDWVKKGQEKKGLDTSFLAEIVNQGKLVSDEIIIRLLSKRLEAGEAKGESGFILDGFPRTIRQAEILDEVTYIDLVVNLKLPENVLLEKCLGRRICSECGKNFNVASINVKGENGNPDISMAPLLSPPQCASKLITRSDDTEIVVKERLRIYNEKSKPLEEFYRNQGKLLEFDLPGGIPESWPKLLEALNLDDREEKQSAAA